VFRSRHRRTSRALPHVPIVQRPRTWPFQGQNTGSNPVGDATARIKLTARRSVSGISNQTAWRGSGPRWSFQFPRIHAGCYLRVDPLAVDLYHQCAANVLGAVAGPLLKRERCLEADILAGKDYSLGRLQSGPFHGRFTSLSPSANGDQRHRPSDYKTPRPNSHIQPLEEKTPTGLGDLAHYRSLLTAESAVDREISASNMRGRRSRRHRAGQIRSAESRWGRHIMYTV
jgi:hypothetical protein